MKTATISVLNDRFRTRLGIPTFGEPDVPGQFVFTQGISSLPPEVQIDLWALVREYDSFGFENDPYGEHDFGAISHPTAGKVFWKIDYYDPSMSMGSDDPADITKTQRVLTIMLAEEY